MKALERIGETKKRTSNELNADCTPKKRRRGSSELMKYLKQRSRTESELCREELEQKKSDQKIQKLHSELVFKVPMPRNFTPNDYYWTIEKI